MRLRNRAVDSRTSLPARCAPADPDEEPGQDDRPDHHQDRHQREVAVGRHDPAHEDHEARRGQDRYHDVERAVRVRGQRVDQAAGEQHDERDDDGLEDERGPPADSRGDRPADQRPGGCADSAHAADHPEGPRAGLQVPEQDGDEDVDGRDQQGGADSQEQGVAHGEHGDAGRGGADHRAEPIDGESDQEAPLAAPLVGQLAARDHEGGHDQEKQGNADLHGLDGGVQVGLDVVDHDVHVQPAKLQMNWARARGSSIFRSDPLSGCAVLTMLPTIAYLPVGHITRPEWPRICSPGVDWRLPGTLSTGSTAPSADSVQNIYGVSRIKRGQSVKDQVRLGTGCHRVATSRWS